MTIELIVIGIGIALGLFGFLVGALLVRRAYRESPSMKHYQGIMDVLTLRKLRKKGDRFGGSYQSDTKKNPIEHYEDMRDKLTLRKKKNVEEEVSIGGGGGFIGNIIGGFIVIMVGVSLIPIITQQVQQAAQTQNVSISPASETVLKMLPFVFGIVIAMVAIMIVFSALRNVGVV